MKLESTPGDMSSWREVDFALNCTYIVPDQVSDLSFSLPKAMTSIPRNLTFDYSTYNEVMQTLPPCGGKFSLMLNSFRLKFQFSLLKTLFLCYLTFCPAIFTWKKRPAD